MTVEKITAADPEARSADVIGDNVSHLAELFPEVMVEGKIDFDVLRQLLGDRVDDGQEKYGLNWHGKRRARQLALTPSTGTLRPCPDESVDWDTTQNLMIEGDNLEVLKLLQKSYAGKVKVIYIDPPYNTGNDFVYPDNFQDSIRNYLDLTGQVDSEGKKLSTNAESSGRFHTDWLNMMHPRLRLARDLLREDGVLFVSLDDTELGSLGFMLNELFGEENFVGRFVWRKKYTLSFRDDYMIPIHEYIVCYRRGSGLVLGDPRWESEDTTSVNPIFKSQNSRSVKTIRKGALLAGGGNTTIGPGPVKLPSQQIEFLQAASFKDGVLVADVQVEAGFAVGQEKLDRCQVEMSRKGAAYVVNEDTETWIRPISILFDYTKDDADFIYGQYQARRVVSTRQASSELAALLADGVFDNPKPTALLTYLVSVVSHEPGDIVLDFFAGSGTTAHAVMLHNQTSGSDWRYVLVQLPEPIPLSNGKPSAASLFCDGIARPRTLSELTKERLRRAATGIGKASHGRRGDTGFRVFKLDSSNIATWDPDASDLATSFDDHIEHLKADRTEEDVLFEVLLKLGLELTVPIETRAVTGKQVHSVGAGTLMMCLATSVELGEVEPLATGIIDWHRALGPGGDTTVVFRDDAFADDVTKTNLVETLVQHGFARKNIRSL